MTVKALKHLGVEGNIKVLGVMRDVSGWDNIQCCKVLRLWAKEGRQTPKKRLFVPAEVEQAIAVWLTEFAPRVDPPPPMPAATPVTPPTSGRQTATSPAPGQPQDPHLAARGRGRGRGKAADSNAAPVAHHDAPSAVAELDGARAEKKAKKNHKSADKHHVVERAPLEIPREPEGPVLCDQVSLYEGMPAVQARQKRLTELLKEIGRRMKKVPHPGERVPVTISEGLEVELMPYQNEGLKWLAAISAGQHHGWLRDEEGLGRMTQTIAMLQYLKVAQENKGPHLVIAPSKEVPQWENHFKRVAPSLKHWLFAGTADELEKLKHKFDKRIRQKLTLVVLADEKMVQQSDWFSQLQWKILIADGGHREALCDLLGKLRCRTRVLVTGEPLKDTVDERWAVLRSLQPGFFPPEVSLRSWFSEPLRKVSPALAEAEVAMQPEDEDRIATVVGALLAPYVFQKTNDQVMEEELFG